jgi:hypothetical protein
MEGFLQELVAN